MADFYKHFEFSRSLNGSQIVQIARNAAGMVVFREGSEKALKKAIDDYWLAQQKAAEVKKKTAPPSRVTKTTTGKFISKSQLEKSATEKSEPARKKRFWS